MTRILIFILIVSTNGFGFYYRQTYNIIDEKGLQIGKKITIMSDEDKLYRQINSIYNIGNYNFMIEAIFTNDDKTDKLKKEKNSFAERYNKDNFLAVMLSIKGNEIEEYYIFLIKSKEGFMFSNCGKKANLDDFYSILNNHKIKQVVHFLDVLLNDEDNGVGLFFSELYKPKNRYTFEECELSCGKLENIFSVPCSENKK